MDTDGAIQTLFKFRQCTQCLVFKTLENVLTYNIIDITYV